MLGQKFHTRSYQCQKRPQGFTLIEILVALVILLVGLLGIAAMQLRSVQNSHASYERSIVTLQARDLVERMWAGICTLYLPNGNIAPNGQATILAAWEADHRAAATFINQGWHAVFESPTVANPHIWTTTISWAGRNQGQTEVISHPFRLPPPLRPNSCI